MPLSRSRPAGARRARRLPRPARRTYRLVVLRKRHLSAKVARLTVGGLDLLNFTYLGGDHRFSALLPWPEDQARALLEPYAMDPWTAGAHAGFAVGLSRPIRRRLTVSDYRPDLLELDFDIILRGGSPLASWVRTAAHGSPIRLINEGRRYQVHPNTHRQILVADESAVPAALGVARSTPQSVRTTVYIEGAYPAADRRQQLGPHVSVTCVDRAQVEAPVGQAVRAAIAAHWDFAEAPDLVGIAGERSFTKSLTSDLRARGVPDRVIHAGVYGRSR